MHSHRSSDPATPLLPLPQLHQRSIATAHTTAGVVRFCFLLYRCSPSAARSPTQQRSLTFVIIATSFLQSPKVVAATLPLVAAPPFALHCPSRSSPVVHAVIAVVAATFFSTYTSSIATPLSLAAAARFLPYILLYYCQMHLILPSS
ncbi:hypothetical protein BHM03_00038611 [Ensete ventricosum]|nr:hypothetical protein BHM03_00038611 [Ensete ventricosum]